MLIQRPLALLATFAATACTPVPAPNVGGPSPILFVKGMEAYSTGGKNWIRYEYDVLNKDQYPAALFASAPSLPPCGFNTNASRTWVQFYDANGTRLYGFCALSSPSELGNIWVAFEEGTVPPSWVYIQLEDRQTNTIYKSNLAETVL